MKNYDPKNIFITLGEILIGGYAEGVYAATETENEAFTKSVGAVGDVTRVRMHNESGRLTVTIVASSPTNDLLTAKHDLDKATGLGYGPLLIKDLNGSTILAAANAWIVKRAEFEGASEASNREWIIDYDKLEGVLGGALV